VQLGKQGSTSATKFETQRAFAFRFCRFGGAESAAAAAAAAALAAALGSF
jgi:hypothetical protein